MNTTNPFSPTEQQLIPNYVQNVDANRPPVELSSPAIGAVGLGSSSAHLETIPVDSHSGDVGGSYAKY